ncbi:hypothetical protein OH492_18050 [Vibrio chagasii]|nr:hypothetical protein [Vibrio chagasii]
MGKNLAVKRSLSLLPNNVNDGSVITPEDSDINGDEGFGFS